MPPRIVHKCQIVRARSYLYCIPEAVGKATLRWGSMSRNTAEVCQVTYLKYVTSFNLYQNFDTKIGMLYKVLIIDGHFNYIRNGKKRRITP